MIDVDKAIANAAKTGKVAFGAKEATNNAKTGKARLIVVATGAQPQILEDLAYYGEMSRIPIASYKGNSHDLGRACGKPFAVATLTVKDPGDSNILNLAQETEKKQVSQENRGEF